MFVNLLFPRVLFRMRIGVSLTHVKGVMPLSSLIMLPDHLLKNKTKHSFPIPIHSVAYWS